LNRSTLLALLVGGLIIAIMAAVYLLATPAGRQCTTDIDCRTHCGIDGRLCTPAGFIQGAK